MDNDSSDRNVTNADLIYLTDLTNKLSKTVRDLAKVVERQERDIKLLRFTLIREGILMNI